jgi:flagellar basal-body rod protein FlgB
VQPWDHLSGEVILSASSKRESLWGSRFFVSGEYRARSWQVVYSGLDARRQKSGIRRKPVAAFLALPPSLCPQSPGLRGFLTWHDACYVHRTKNQVTRRFPDMSISFDKALGIHEQALGFRAQRAEVLANNIANADTPNYKARDLDFSKVLAAQSEKNQNGTIALNMTNSRHIEAQGLGNGDESLMYRTPMQPSIDQNTVDAQLEQSNYAENAIGFQASFTLLNSKFKGLVSALRGE